MKQIQKHLLVITAAMRQIAACLHTINVSVAALLGPENADNAEKYEAVSDVQEAVAMLEANELHKLRKALE